MVVKYVVRADAGFMDMNILDHAIRPGETETVDENTYLRMKQSDPSLVLVERVVPNPRKKEEDKEEKSEAAKDDKSKEGE
jgi:hypothetical protein